MDKCSKCRKFGAKLFLKGERCLSAKCPFTRRSYQPGAHGLKQNVRRSEYGLELQEKQKAKTEYNLREKGFRQIFRRASKSRQATGEELLRLLEMRLDNVVYRLGWAFSRRQARQLVSHRKIKINDKIVNIPSAVLKPKDKISLIEAMTANVAKTNIPQWLKYDSKKKIAEVLHRPLREEIETDLDEQKILEFYSR